MKLSKKIENIASDNSIDLSPERQPDWISPMLATLTHDYFADPEWIFERKLDGERALAFVKSGEVRLLSRNKKLLNKQYPELPEALENSAESDMILDGELVAFDGNVTSFSRLQDRMHVDAPSDKLLSEVPVYYYIFDIPRCAGYNLEKLPLRDRKKILLAALDFEDPLRFTEHRNAESLGYFRDACDKGWEGIIAKDGRGEYVHSRSRLWLKFKCSRRQEFVVGGYTEPGGSRIGFGAILIGYYENGELVFAGKVGTGFDNHTLERLGEKMSELEIEGSPFDRGEHDPRGVHWIEPKIVAEVGFTEWTDKGKLRHPRFLGTREDKPPREVHRERPK